MTPTELLRDPQIDSVIATFRSLDYRGIVHKINTMFSAHELHSLTDEGLSELIRFRVENAKNELTRVVAKAIP